MGRCTDAVGVKLGGSEGCLNVRNAQTTIGKLTSCLDTVTEGIFRVTDKQHAFLQPCIRVAVGAHRGAARAVSIVSRLLTVLR